MHTLEHIYEIKEEHKNEGVLRPEVIKNWQSDFCWRIMGLVTAKDLEIKVHEIKYHEVELEIDEKIEVTDPETNEVTLATIKVVKPCYLGFAKLTLIADKKERRKKVNRNNYVITLNENGVEVKKEKIIKKPRYENTPEGARKAQANRIK